MKKWCAILAALFAGACATLEDFQAMSPDERAAKVCSGTDAYRQRRWSLTNLDNAISEKQELLATGYRVHEYCQILPVAIPGKAANCSGLTGDEFNACQQSTVPATVENRRICKATAIPIDYQYESAALRDLQLQRAEELDFHDEQTYMCEARARSLSATEAYSRYKANAEP